MKPIYTQAGAALALTFAIAACVPAPTSAPPPEPAPTGPAPTPTPTQSITLPTYERWIDAPKTPGDWSYRATASESRASFTSGGAIAFDMICTPAKQIALVRLGPGKDRIAILTETSERAVPANPQREATVATLSPNDPLLDAMALTRGRFAVETPGQTPLYLPAWAEVTRVIEDCR